MSLISRVPSCLAPPLSSRVLTSPPLCRAPVRAVTELLQHEEDLVVRLAAAQTLKDAVDDFEFCPETFMPFLPACFSQLFRLLQEARECDTKMQVRC